MTGFFTRPGFPIRTPPDQSLIGDSPRLFAAIHVLLRLLAPRHPSHALSSLLSSNFSYSQKLKNNSLSAPERLCFPTKTLSRNCSSTYSLFNDPLGADRDRTGDFWLAKPALSLLSYSPEIASPPGFLIGPGWI